MIRKFKGKIVAVAALGTGFLASTAHAALPEGHATTIGGYITEVGTIASSALLIAGGVALTMVIIKYVRRAGK